MHFIMVIKSKEYRTNVVAALAEERNYRRVSKKLTKLAKYKKTLIISYSLALIFLPPTLIFK